MYRYIYLIGWIFFIVSCKNNPANYQPTVTVIEGQLASVENPLITLDGHEQYKAPVDPSGNFLIQATLNKAGIYKIKADHTEFHVFLVPGDKISITGDIRESSTIKFKGSHSIENNYLIAFQNVKTTTEDQDFATFFSKTESDFINAVEKRTQVLVDHQQQYQKDNGTFDDVFAGLITDEIHYDAAILKLNYPDFYTYLNPDSQMVLSDTYESFLQNIDVDNDAKFMVPSYKDFLPLYLTFKTQTEKGDSLQPLLVRKFKNISSKFQNVKVRDMMYYTLMKEGIETSLNDAVLVIDEFNKVEQNKQYTDEINHIFDSWRHLLKGNPAPQWEYQSVNKSKIHSKSLQGKVTYIDIWATWCGPCLRELPSLHILEEKYKDQPVQFVSISIDEEKEAWKKMVIAKKMKGIQLIADANWNSSIVTDYKINGIPRFIILDKTGKIFNANAPRPSSKEIMEELDAAISK